VKLQIANVMRITLEAHVYLLSRLNDINGFIALPNVALVFHLCFCAIYVVTMQTKFAGLKVWKLCKVYKRRLCKVNKQPLGFVIQETEKFFHNISGFWSLLSGYAFSTNLLVYPVDFSEFVFLGSTWIWFGFGHSE
jgi:hypothetical protein